jgi:hypothetical protein
MEFRTMIWEELGDNGDGEMVYQRVDDDGTVRITAVKGYPELDAYLAWVEAGNKPEDFWKQNESEI